METETQIVTKEVPTRQLDREEEIDNRFEKIERQLANQPTKEEFALMLAGLASKEDVARLNNIVHNFTLGVSILEKSGKWIFYSVATVGGFAAGFFVLKSSFIAIIMWLAAHIK